MLQAWKMWNEEKVAELVDPMSGSPSTINQVKRCVHIALLCVQDRVSDRPDIDNIIRMMDNETSVLPMPKQPTFVVERSPSETESTTNKYGSFSTSDVTVTVLTGR